MRLQVTADERGSVLVITVVVLATLLVFAAYAIDEGIWFVHHGHLQTEADAAALAGAQNFQYPCTAGGAMDEQIATTVHRYDGTTVSGGGYNEQVPVTPTPATIYSPTQHNLISQINQPNFINQSQPNDSGLTGSPCTDAAIDVKLSETNLASFFPFVSPKYITAQARVSIESEASGSGNEPLAIPSPAPSTMSATLINESNGSTLAGPVSLSPDSTGTSWTGNAGNVRFPTSGTVPGSVPVGLRVAMGQGPSCGSQLQCYDSGSANGIVYTRDWSVSGAPGSGGPAVPPQAEDVTLAPMSSGECLGGNVTFSNFISSSSCSVQLSATVLFAPGAVCGSAPNVALKLTVNGQNPAMTCKGATVQTTSPCSTTAPCVKTTWTSAAVSAGADSPDGPVNFDLEWTQKYGTTPSGAKGGNKGVCETVKPCTDSFGTVQRMFNGATNQAQANTSRSGPIIGATVTDKEGEVMSVQGGTQESLTITVNILNLGYKDDSTVAVGNPVTLHTGGSQGTFAIECNGNNGSSFFTTYMTTGCPQQFAMTDQPNPPICSSPPPGPAVCVTQNPGGGKVVEPGIDQRVNGSQSASTCVSPNHWTSPNTIHEILTPPNANDPRLVQLLIVDSAAWVGVNGSKTETPIRQLATFYITGWSGPTATPLSQGGDPCFNSCPTAPSTPCTSSGSGLPYTSDDNPGAQSNVLLGHFVKWVCTDSASCSPPPNPQQCSQNTFGNCIAVLTK
jgi:hypothetical protein